MAAVALFSVLGALCTWAGTADATPFGHLVQVVGAACFLIAMTVAYRRHRATRADLPGWTSWLRRF